MKNKKHKNSRINHHSKNNLTASRKLKHFHKETKHIFLIESPLQLMNASIFVKQKKISNPHAIIFKSRSSENNHQIRKVASNFRERWGNIAITRKSIDFYRKNYLYKQATLYIGDLRSSWMKTVVNKSNSREIILMDDGAASIMYNKNIDQIRNLESGEKKLKALTTYEVSMPIEKINLNYEEIKNKKNKYNGHVFLGSALPFKSNRNIEKYIERIKEITTAADKITYIPHRAEPKSFSRFLKKTLGIKVVNPGMPFELWYSKRVHGIRKISGLNTSCFYSMPIIDSKIIYTCYRSRTIEDDLSKNWKPWGHSENINYSQIMDVFYTNLDPVVEIIEI